MDPNTNNSGASAPPQPQDDLGQTRYFPPVGQAGAQVPQVPAAAQPQEAPAAPVAQAAPTYQGNGYGQGQGPTASPYQAQPQPQSLPQPQPGYGYNPQTGTNSQAGPAPQHSPIWQGQHDQHRGIWGLVLVGAGVLFLIDQLFSFSGFGSLVLLLIGGVFMYAYYNTRPGPRIGFLIPGAILLGLGVGTALETLDFFNIWGDQGSIITLCLGLGFCLIWLLERKHWWALIPGGILVMVGLGTMAVFGKLWPLILIALGVYLLYEQSRRRVIH